MRLLLMLLLTFWAAGASATSVFINELRYQNSGSGSQEFIEIAGPPGTFMFNWMLVMYDGHSGQVYHKQRLPLTSLPNSGLLVITFTGNTLHDNQAGVALVDRFGRVRHFISYGGAFMARNDVAGGLTSIDIGVQQSADGTSGRALQLAGNGISYEDFAWRGAEPATPGKVNLHQTFADNFVPPSILINEVDANQTQSDSAEFIELYDGGRGNTPLDGLMLVLYDGNTGRAYDGFELDGMRTSPSGYFVLCGRNNSVEHCQKSTQQMNSWLDNGVGAVGLFRADMEDFERGLLVYDGLIDWVVYGTDAQLARDLLVFLTGGTLVNENERGHSGVDALQRCPNGSGLPRQTVQFAAFPATPGRFNTCAVAAPPVDPLPDEPPLYVNLTDFSATPTADGVRLHWQTGVEINSAGFHVWRAQRNAVGKFIDIKRLTPLLIPARGSVQQGADYQFTDITASPDSTYFYALTETDFNGQQTWLLDHLLMMKTQP